MIARHSNDPLDSKSLVNGITQNHDIAAFRSPEIINPSVEQVLLRITECGNHTFANHLDRLQDKMTDDEIAGHGQPGDREALINLLKERRRVRPLPGHAREQVFGSGVSYRFSTHQVDTTMLGIVRLNNWGKIRNLITGKVRIVYPRCAEVNGDG